MAPGVEQRRHLVGPVGSVLEVQHPEAFPVELGRVGRSAVSPGTGAGGSERVARRGRGGLEGSADQCGQSLQLRGIGDCAIRGAGLGTGDLDPETLRRGFERGIDQG